MRIRVADEWYPVDTQRLVGFIVNPAILPVPKAPPEVAGLMLCEGQAVPVLWPGGRAEEACRCAVLLRDPGNGLYAYMAHEAGEEGDAEDARFDAVF